MDKLCKKKATPFIICRVHRRATCDPVLYPDPDLGVPWRCSVTKARVEALMQESQDAHYKLEITPTTTEEYVTFLTFLDDISIRVRQPTVPLFGSC